MIPTVSEFYFEGNEMSQKPLLSEDTIRNIIEALLNGVKQNFIAKSCNISEATVSRCKKLLKKNGYRLYYDKNDIEDVVKNDLQSTEELHKEIESLKTEINENLSTISEMMYGYIKLQNKFNFILREVMHQYLRVARMGGYSDLSREELLTLLKVDFAKRHERSMKLFGKEKRYSINVASELALMEKGDFRRITKILDIKAKYHSWANEKRAAYYSVGDILKVREWAEGYLTEQDIIDHFLNYDTVKGERIRIEVTNLEYDPDNSLEHSWKRIAINSKRKELLHNRYHSFMEFIRINKTNPDLMQKAPTVMLYFNKMKANNNYKLRWTMFMELFYLIQEFKKRGIVHRAIPIRKDNKQEKSTLVD